MENLDRAVFGYEPAPDLCKPEVRQDCAKEIGLRHRLDCATYFDVVKFGDDIHDAMEVASAHRAAGVKEEWRNAVMADLEARCADPAVTSIELSPDLWTMIGWPDALETTNDNGPARVIRVDVRGGRPTWEQIRELAKKNQS